MAEGNKSTGMVVRLLRPLIHYEHAHDRVIDMPDGPIIYTCNLHMQTTIACQSMQT